MVSRLLQMWRALGTKAQKQQGTGTNKVPPFMSSYVVEGAVVPDGHDELSEVDLPAHIAVHDREDAVGEGAASELQCTVELGEVDEA